MLTEILLLSILYFYFPLVKSMDKLFNNMDKRFGNLFGGGYDYPVKGKRDISILMTKNLYCLEEKEIEQ